MNAYELKVTSATSNALNVIACPYNDTCKYRYHGNCAQMHMYYEQAPCARLSERITQFEEANHND